MVLFSDKEKDKDYVADDESEDKSDDESEDETELEVEEEVHEANHAPNIEYDRFVVNLQERTCSCRQWQVSSLAQTCSRIHHIP
jgi:hypothetical protein